MNKADPKLRSCNHMTLLMLHPRLSPRRVTQQVSTLSFVFEGFLITPRNIRGSGLRSLDHMPTTWEGTHSWWGRACDNRQEPIRGDAQSQGNNLAHVAQDETVSALGAISIHFPFCEVNINQMIFYTVCVFGISAWKFSLYP